MPTIRAVSPGSGPRRCAGRSTTTTMSEIGLVPTDGTPFDDPVRTGPGEEGGQEPHPPRSHDDVHRRPERDGRAVDRARRPPHRRRPDPQTTPTSCSPIRKATSSASSSRPTTSSPPADVSDRSRATVRERSGTSGAKRSVGRWSGIRTRKPRSGHPDGTGPFITWGPPVAPKTAKNRLHLDIAPPADGDQQAEVERLVSPRGATRIDIGQGDVSWVVMADPDGNEFCVLTPR